MMIARTATPHSHAPERSCTYQLAGLSESRTALNLIKNPQEQQHQTLSQRGQSSCRSPTTGGHVAVRINSAGIRTPLEPLVLIVATILVP